MHININFLEAKSKDPDPTAKKVYESFVKAKILTLEDLCGLTCQQVNKITRIGKKRAYWIAVMLKNNKAYLKCGCPRYCEIPTHLIGQGLFRGSL